MPPLDTALSILSSGSVGLTQTRFQELQLSLAKMELETKRETMREEVLMRKEQRQRENTLYALDTSEKFLKEEKFNAAQSVIGNLVGILPDFKEDMSIKQIKKQMKNNVPDEALQNKIASIVFNYYSESEASQLAAIESATNLSEYINSEYMVSKSEAKATPGLNNLIKAGLVSKPDAPDFEASVLPYGLLSKTKDIKRNIAKERAEIGAGDYTIQEDILLPTEMEAAFEALAVGTDDQSSFDAALEAMGSTVGGEKIKFATGSVAEAKNDYVSSYKQLSELELQERRTKSLIDRGFGGTAESNLLSLSEEIEKQKELVLDKRNAFHQAQVTEESAELEEEATESLAAHGLQETAENIAEMKKQLKKEKSISVLPSRVGAMMGFGSFGSPTLRRSVGTLSE